MAAPATLFRFVRLTSPRVYDLTLRASGNDLLKPLLDRKSSGYAAALEVVRADWSEDHLATLEHRYRSPFADDMPFAGYLPSGRDIETKAGDQIAALLASPNLGNDLARVQSWVVMLSLDGEAKLARRCAQLAQLIEALPTIAERKFRQPYSPVVTERFQQTPKKTKIRTKAKGQARAAATKVRPTVDPDQLRSTIAQAWQLRNLYARELRANAERLANDLEKALPKPAKKPVANAKAKAAPAGKAARKAAKDKARRAQAIAHFKALRVRQQKRAAMLKQVKAAGSDLTVGGFLSQPSADIAKVVGAGWNKDVIDKLKAALRDATKGFDFGIPGLGGKPGKPDKPGKPTGPGSTKTFCALYEDVQTAIDVAPPASIADTLNLPALTPTVVAVDNLVELLGSAELIKVEERTIGYSETDISYVENILAGEKRLRREKTTREFESVEQVVTVESTTNTSEKRSTTNLTLSSEVETAINTRFNTDIATGGSASGGGTIGVVSMQGQGSFSLGVGIGVDTSLRSNEQSEFGTEIVDAATEAITRSTQTSRTTRTRSLFETMNRYEIDNTVGTNPVHRRGVYCFLNRHVRVTETPYGVRWFLRARLSTPGRSLLDERRARLAIKNGAVEIPPPFDIGPNDVHPTNYMALAKRFHAQGLAPPPQATRHLARTYKCDTSNASEEKSEGLEKLGKSIMPFFKAYRRHLITDTLELPDGYMLQEVRLTIDHGANGLSIPVDLPFKLAGAAFAAIPTAAAYPFIFVPIALWQVMLLASPLLHHNTDSSAVTATIGNESMQSDYFFFDAEFLIAEIFQLFGSFSAMGDGVLAEIQQLVDDLPGQLQGVAQTLANSMRATAQSLADSVATVFNSIVNALNNIDPLDVAGLYNALLAAFGAFGAAVTTNLPNTLFAPLTNFVQQVLQLIADAAENAFSDLMAALMALTENSQTLNYSESYGATGALPLAFNIVALKPSVTITLNACVARTDRALDEWRLQTFERLYQAHLQQAAEHDARSYFAPPAAQSPGTLRQSELRALRNQVIAALDQARPRTGAGPIPYDRINLFEHTIDWENISYRTFDYGPGIGELLEENDGLYAGIDAQHRNFLGAAWAEAMLPLSSVEALEQAMLAYFESGSTAIDSKADGTLLTNDELTQLWQDVISRRQLYAETPEPVATRDIVLPTDLVVLRTDDSLPGTPISP